VEIDGRASLALAFISEALEVINAILLNVYVMNIEWDYNYYQTMSDNKWLVDEMLAILDENITMQ